MSNLTQKVNLILSQLFPKHTKKETSLKSRTQMGSLRDECELNRISKIGKFNIKVHIFRFSWMKT